MSPAGFLSGGRQHKRTNKLTHYPLTDIFKGSRSEENMTKNVEFMCRLQEKNLCGILAPCEENETGV